MLILVGVSVIVALNGGLFETAQNASEGTKAEGEKERLLSIALGTLDNKGIVDRIELNTALNGPEFTVNADGTITSTKTEKTYVVSERGSVTEILQWTHADANNNGTFDAGEVVTASNGESFYVIATPGASDETVKLLAAKCVDTREEIEGETNSNYNKQSDTYNTVAFDALTNVYANASIKKLVETYVTETLILNANQGRLMLAREAFPLEYEHSDMIYGTTTKWNYWLCDAVSDYDNTVNMVMGTGPYIDYDNAGRNNLFGLRPVIELAISNIK